jgi:peptidoglycan/xylan/chitin deacetylase (PgdA/CDA1 family)
MSADRFVVLLYHDVHPGAGFDYGPIGRSATMYHVAEETFRRHVRLIQESRLAVIGLEALRERLGNPKRSAGRPGVALCFDDGWRGAVERAAAALAELGLPAFFFITTELVGRPLFAAPGDLRRLPPGLFTVGSHGVTHRMLSSLRPAEIRRELAESRARLEDLLGRPVTALSLPGGAADRRVVGLAEEAGYREIFTSAVGLNPTALGRRSIARIAVRRSTDDVTLRRWLAFQLGRERLLAGALAVPKRLLGMRAYARLRRLLLGEGSGHRHVFEP